MLAHLPLEEKVNAVDAIHWTNVIKVVVGLETGEVLLWTLSFPDAGQIGAIEEVDRKSLLRHEDELMAVRFNKVGSKCASCGLDRNLIVCDIDTGMILFRKELSSGLICMDWSPRGDLLYLGDSTGFLHVWSMTVGETKCKKKIFNGPITCVTASRSDSRVVAAGVEFNEFLVKGLVIAST